MAKKNKDRENNTPLAQLARELKRWDPKDGILPLRDLAMKIRKQDVVPQELLLAIQYSDEGKADKAKDYVQRMIGTIKDTVEIRQQRILPQRHMYTIVGKYLKKYRG